MNIVANASKLLKSKQNYNCRNLTGIGNEMILLITVVMFVTNQLFPFSIPEIRATRDIVKPVYAVWWKILISRSRFCGSVVEKF